MSKGTDYMTVVFRMPNDVAQRKAFSAALQFGEEFHGARITAMALEDESTVLELIEQHEDFDESIAAEARAQMRELHAAEEAAE